MTAKQGRYSLAIRASARLAQRAADRNAHKGPWEELLPIDSINWNRQENIEVRRAWAAGDKRGQRLEGEDLLLTSVMTAFSLGLLDEDMEQLAREDGRRMGRMELQE